MASWGGGCCNLLKSTVKIFDIYTVESKYIQAAKGEGDDLSLIRGTFGTANIQPMQSATFSLFSSFHFCPIKQLSSKSVFQENPALCTAPFHLLSLSLTRVMLRGLKW